MALPSPPTMSSKPVQSAGCPRQELAFLPGADGAKQRRRAVQARRPKPGAQTPGVLAHLEEGSARQPASLNPGGRWERAAAPALPTAATRGQPRAARRGCCQRRCNRCAPLLPRQPPGAGERGTLDKGSGQESVPPGPQEAETVSGAETPPKANQGLSRVGRGRVRLPPET